MAVVPIVRWLLPWLCVLAVSATIAHAAGDALGRTLQEPPAPVVSTTQAPCKLDTCPHWVNISSVDTDGHAISLKCLVNTARFQGDALQVHFADLNSVVSEICNELWES
jgi:hypothetical protein